MALLMTYQRRTDINVNSATGAHSAGAEAQMLAARPFLDYLHDLDRRLDVLRDAAPSGEATGAYGRIREELAEVFEAARRTDLWMTVEQAHRASGIPKSTLTRLCRDRAVDLGAKKIGRAWSISAHALHCFLRASP